MSATIQFSPEAPPAIEQIWWTRSWSSRLDLKQEVIDTVQATLLERGQIVGEDIQWLVLCLDEAVTNAMLHGNEGDHTVPIELQMGSVGERWVVTVTDQGDGFSPAQIPDCEDPANLLLEHGRGIRLMLEWLDELVYYRGGACVWFARRPAPKGNP